MKSIRRFLQQNIFVLLGPLLAVAIASYPLQLHMSLSRYQHYGLAVFAWGFCYIWQFIWYYKVTLPWSRLCFLFTGLYLASAGFLFYLNPWLDVSADLITSQMRVFRLGLGITYLVLALPIFFAWYMSYLEERHAEQQIHKH